MKQVQEALKGIGIEVYQDVYRPKSAQNGSAAQFIVYVTRTVEENHYDDEAHGLKTWVYMNLWSTGNPNAMAKMVKKAMKQAGFAMVEEETGSTSGEAKYAEGPKMFCVNWTWVFREEAEEDGDSD